MKILEGLDEDWKHLTQEKIQICDIKIKLEKDLKELEEEKQKVELEKREM